MAHRALTRGFAHGFAYSVAVVCALLRGAPPSSADGHGRFSGSWNLSAVCTTRHNFSATSWDNLCGDPGDGIPGPGAGTASRCKLFTNLVPSMVIDDGHFGDNASTLVPLLVTGRPAAGSTSAGPTLRCGSGGAAPPGSCPMGINALPKGLRSIRFSGVDRSAMLGAEEDNILPGYNGTGWAPEAPCQPGIVAQEKGPYPGIWLGA